MRTCTYCGNSIPHNVNFCEGCGAKNEDFAPAAPRPPQFGPPGAPPPAPGMPGFQPNPFAPQYPPAAKTKAIVGLVLGICAMVIPIPFLDIIAAIVGLVLANQAKNMGFKGGLQTGALVCSIIGLIWSIIFTCSCLISLPYYW